MNLANSLLTKNVQNPVSTKFCKFPKSLKNKRFPKKSLVSHKKSGTPEGIRTPDLLVRSQTLYPAELLAHSQFRLPYKNTTALRYCQHFFQFPSTKLSRGIPTGQLRTKRPQPSVLQPLLLQIADARFPMPHKPSP